jgi:hypothetical protein
MGARTDFLNDEVYPRLFEMIDTAFPNMGFKRYYRGWRSNKKLDGTARQREDKTIITKDFPSRIYEQGDYSMSLIDYQMEMNNQTFDEALASFCEVVGLEVPSFDTKEYKDYQKRQDDIFRLQEKLQTNLKSPGAKEVLDYLHNERGYDDETIDTMGLGYMDRESMTIMADLFGGVKDMSSYSLTIPYKSGGKILGYKFRRLDGIAPKYKNTPKLPKQANLFGLTGLKLTGNNEKDRDITIVEGELDALHAQSVGIDNIVAAAGGELAQEALEKAKIRGVKRVTILFDSEATEEGQKKTRTKIKSAVSTIHNCGLKSFVAQLPNDEGIKMDVDSFLKDNPKEGLEKIIADALSGAMFVFNCIIEDSYNTDINTFKDLDEFKDKVLSLLNSPITTPTDRMFICRHFAEITGQPWTEHAIREEADELYLSRNKKEQEIKTIQTAQSALSLAQSGQVQEAIDLMSSTYSELQLMSRESEFMSLLSLPSDKELQDYMMTTPSAVSTEYQFKSRNGDIEDFELPSGAITFICALPGHGKSTMLQNLALQVSCNGEEGSVLYFTFEEDKHSVVLQMMNKHMNFPFSANNMRSLTSFYRSGSNQMVKDTERQKFELKRKEFLNQVYHPGKLRVYGEDYDSKDLIEAIKYLSKNMKVKAVFIDYIQLLKKRGCKLQRNEELKEICVDLKNAAIFTGLPIVAAAQFNREARNPMDMCSQNIAEAADLERIANKIVCLWDCRQEPRAGTGDNKKQLESFMEELGVKWGESKIIARMTKNRSGINNIAAVLAVNGNTGYIAPNRKEELKAEQKSKPSGKPVIYMSRHTEEEKENEGQGLPF